MDESGGKRSSRARGRIAEVLADARASLTEPSRPFTPASLDQRTSLSNINSLDKHGRIAMSRTSVGRRTTSKKSTNNAYGQSGGEYDMYNNEGHGEVKDVKFASSSRETSPKGLVTASNPPKTSASNNISASIHYINSILPTNDDSCENSHRDWSNRSNQSDGSSQRQHLISSEEFCTNAKSAVDTICKFLKNDRAKDPEDIRGVVSLIQRIFQFFSTCTESNSRNENENENKNENENIDDGANERNRKLTSRIILLLCTAIISKKDILFDNCESTSTFKKKSLIPKMILKTVKNLFQHLKSVNEIKTVRSSSISEKTYKMNGQSYSDSNDHSKNHSNISYNISSNNDIDDGNYDNNGYHNFDKKKKHMSPPNSTTSSNYVIENNLDLLLEFQNSMSVMIPDVGIKLLNKIDQIRLGNDVVISHHNNGSNSNNHEYDLSKSNRNNNSSGSNNVSNINENNNKDDDDDTSNDSDGDGMSDNNENDSYKDKLRGGNGNEIQNNFIKEERLIFMLLEASIFSAGITRHHSTDESIRKLINKFNVIEIVSEKLRAVGSFTVICQKRIISNTEKVKNEIISKFKGEKANELCLKIINKLSEIVVQLVVIIRNYSVDSDGKSQLINTKIVGLLCSLLKPFKNYPELVLNCVRVTAKLSLQDNFRAQINSKTSQIKCLIDVLVQEGTICLDVMNGTSKKTCINTNNHQNGNTSNTNDNSEDHHNNSDNNTNVTDSTSWPYWYTWPLISRIAFTLGNLTTSNSLNRIKIGLECKSLDSIFCLLQACTGFLTAVYSAKNTAHLSDFNDSKEVHSNDNEEFNDSDSDSDEGDADPANDNDSKGTMELELADSTIKLLRLLANLCIEEGVGEKIVENPDIIEMLTDLIACTSSTYTQTEKGEVTESKIGSRSTVKRVVGSNHSSSDSKSNSNSNNNDSNSHSVVLGLGDEIGEELLLNAIAVCTNITFYACKDDNNYSKESRIVNTQGVKHQNNSAKSNNNKTILKKEKQSVILSKLLSHCLFHDNDEIILESARALGNLTRLRAVTRSMILTRCDETLLLLLAHTNTNIVTAVSGALVNLSGGPDWRVTYTVQTSPKDSVDVIKSNPFAHLVSILRRTSLKNIPLSVLVCQILHNLLYVTENEEAFSEKEYPEEKNNHECPTKFVNFYHKIPSLLSETLIELIDCADDMIEALSSITIQQNEKNKDCKENKKENKYDNVNHIFQIPQLINTNDDMKKYTDFTVIGRKVLTVLKLSYH